METQKNERLLAVRQYLRMTQSQFAKSLGINQSSYSQAERGLFLSGELIRNLSKIYNVNSEWLLNGEGEMFKTLTKEDIQLPPPQLSSKEINYKDEIIEEMRATIEFLKAELQYLREDGRRKTELLAK